MLTFTPVQTDEHYAAYRSVRVAVEPGQRVPTVGDMKSYARPGRNLVLAHRDGVLVACGVSDRSDAIGRASVAPRVLPEHRRQGIGTALLRHLCQLAEPLGVPVIGALADDPGAVAFGLHHGFKEVDRQVEQARVIGNEPAPIAPSGVDIVSVEQRPQLWAQAYDAVAVQGFSDMAASREIRISRDDWERHEMNEPAATFLALRDGAIVGVALLLTDEETPQRAEHGLTAVIREERGRGIASALKRQCLWWASQNGVTEVYTWTQRDNEDMRGLNERLGYHYAQVSVTLESPLPLPRPQ